MGIEDRLQKLEGEYPPPACEEQPCQRAAAFTVWDRREDGTMALVRGKVPPPLCAACPYREDSRARHVQVVRNAYG
jgi:hypothetical protein